MQAGKSSGATTNSAHPRKHRVSSLLLRLCLILIVLIALAELVLRFGLGLGNPAMAVSDQACDYIIKPDQAIYRFFAHASTNHYGMRSDPIPPVKDPHTARLYFLGDSITYGTTRVDQKQIFAERVHHELPPMLGAPVEVLNASASAWAIDNELSYVQSRGTFQSDLLILVLNTGDIWQPRSTIASVGEGLATVKPHFALEELYERYILPRIHRSAAPPRVDAGDLPAQYPTYVKENEARLDTLKKYAADHHMDFVVVYAPFRVNMDPGNIFYKFSEEGHTDTLAWTTSRNVPVLDLSSVLARYPVKEITLDGLHFNAKGNEVAAHEIEKFIVSLHSAHKILQQFP